MPAYWENYPKTRHPIEFRLLKDLVSDRRYRLWVNPALEHPQQLSLDRDDPKLFKSIPRDFCILTSPGYRSWQTRKSQKEPKLEIFDTDVVEIPAIDLKSKFQSGQRDRSDASYLNRYYHEGLTRVNIEKIFKDRFGLLIPLSSESSSEHWVPAVILYTVEIEQNVWQDRLAVVFDGNVGLSQQSMMHRTKVYGQNLRQKDLGKLYLDLWRARWAERKQKLRFLEARIDDLETGVKVASMGDCQAKASGTPGGRGRKRRAVLRRLRNGGVSLIKQNDAGNDASSAKVAVEITAIPKRGRLKRRERRRNGCNRKESKSDTLPEAITDASSGTTSSRFESLNLNRSQIWRFNNGEIGRENQNNNVPVSLFFRFDQPDGPKSRTLGRSTSKSSEGSQAVIKGAFIPQVEGIPELIVQPLDGSRGLSNPKCYHIVSYCNQNADPTGTVGFPEDPFIDRGWGDIDDEEIPELKDYQIHIADLVDAVGVVDTYHWRANVFFSVIEADPLSLITSPILTSGSSVTSKEQGHYWHKFAGLLHGFTNTDETRELPYSLGYGVDHNNPVLVSRDNRWGYLDVDAVTMNSKRPRWRAAWRFEPPISDTCECSLNKVMHDLNTCKRLYKEEAKVGDAVWRSRFLSDEILSELVAYAHKPYEYLRDLEQTLHKYYPPYVPPVENQSTSSSSGSVKSSSESDVADMKDASLKKLEEEPVSRIPGSEESSQDSENQNVGVEVIKDFPDNETMEKEDIEKNKQQSKRAERTYELGICSLVALGVPKDIRKGIALIKMSAELGCFRAQETASAIASAYGADLDVSDETLRSWLSETCIRGSRIALHNLRTLFPESYQKCLSVRQDTLDFRYPEIISCADDVLPHFDLSNSRRLHSQIQNLKVKRKEEAEQAVGMELGIKGADLNVMARLREETKNDPPQYFVFGSLLHLAAAFGYKDAVIALLDSGFDINAHNTLPALRTPLLLAMSRGQADIAKILITRGANCQPLTMWAFEDMFCATPTAMHYLVNIESDSKMKDLARLLVKNGADVNYKCDVEHLRLQTPTEISFLKGRSVTPLRWAVIHRKPQVVRILLSLGAKFAYEEYFRPSLQENTEKKDLQQGCLLLETPCTDLDILEMFYARARVPGLPIEFSQTPLGLLVSEDDGPERRLRLGFGDFDSIREALDLCLELQPGFEEVLMWSVVRHDHVDIVKYLLEELGWDIESKWKGLTSLHTSILYGRTELVHYLLARGADATAKTESRQLTCLHLLMLLPRHPQVDQEIFSCISKSGIDINAREKIDGLTALHLAVRNQKLPMVRQLLEMGADPHIPVADQLSILSQGKGGYLERTSDRPQLFTENLTILGEVLLQYNQDNFYDMHFVADLLFLLLDRLPAPLSEEDLIVDKGISLSILHILSIFPPHSGSPHVYRRDAPQGRWNEPPPTIPQPPTAPASLLQLVLLRSSPSAINAPDFQGDTPLHYACAAHQVHHIRALLSAGADPSIRNKTGLNPVEVMAWSIIFLSSKTFLFHETRKSWHPEIDFSPGYNGKKYKRGKHPASDLSIAFSIFADLGLTVDERLKRLILAWDFARMRDDEDMFNGSKRRKLEFVPVESARGILGDEDPDSRVDENGEYDTDWDKKMKRPYTLVSVKGASKWRTQYGTEEWARQQEIDFERQAL